MAERSMPWDSTGTGDGTLTGYTETQTLEMFRDLFTGDQYASMGVLAGVGGELAVTGSTMPLTVATGAGMVYGLYYQNTAALSLTNPPPVIGTTGLRVSLRADWAAQTVRAVIIKNADNTAAPPGLTQTALTTFDIPLVTGTITTGGSVSLTDARTFVRMPTALIARRQGGSSSDWSIAGSSNYTPGETIRQMGAIQVTYSSGSGTATVTFPTPFSAPPHIQLTTFNNVSSTRRKILATVESVTATTLVIRTYLTDESTTSSNVDIYWMAIGAI